MSLAAGSPPKDVETGKKPEEKPAAGGKEEEQKKCRPVGTILGIFFFLLAAVLSVLGAFVWVIGWLFTLCG
eukprot:EC684435.1.p4 GENE.EC684435.1~~EC684435.1.p4  ORF type:complete len:71 (+),score=26.83 EC684435.1:54-266(+)